MGNNIEIGAIRLGGGGGEKSFFGCIKRDWYSFCDF